LNDLLVLFVSGDCLHKIVLCDYNVVCCFSEEIVGEMVQNQFVPALVDIIVHNAMTGQVLQDEGEVRFSFSDIDFF
jgi:hypothetical protein